MINAGSGITPKVDDMPPDEYSLGVATTLIEAIDLYKSVTAVQRYRTLYDNGTRQSLMTGGARVSFDDLAFAQCPALVNRAPYKDSGSSPYPGTPINSDVGNAGPPEWRTPYSPSIRWMTDFILTNARLVMGYTDPENLVDDERDLTKFAQIQAICDAYRGQANTQINSAVNSEIVAATFTGMEDLSTSGVSQVSTTPGSFGADLVNLGDLINLKNLDYLGYPSSVFKQMLSAGGLLPGVYDALLLAGLTQPEIFLLSQNKVVIESNIELKLYQSLMMIQNENLEQVLELLEIDATDMALTTAADLLDPKKILPNTYQTLIVQKPAGNGQVENFNVYLDGTINSSIADLFVADEFYINLRKIIPDDQALANSALIRSLKQVKNIINIDFRSFAAFSAALESVTDLSSVNDLSAPVPATIQTIVQDSLATGTGENNSLTLYDLIGTAAGWVHTESFDSAANILGTVDTQNLVTLYKTTTDTLAGLYTNPIEVDPGPPPVIMYQTVVPGSGTYLASTANASISLAVSDNTSIGLVPQMVVEVNDIVAGFPQQVEQLNQLWSNMAEQINREAKNRYMAELIFQFGPDEYPDLKPNSRSSALAMISSLHSFGTETSPNGTADFFNAVAQNTLGGQSVIASLREGRNINAMIDAGVGVDTQLPATPL